MSKIIGDEFTMASVSRNCLVCDYGSSTTEGKENYQEVSVCPKCNGAFVDLFYINKYMKKDWKPNKEIQNGLMNKAKHDAVDAIMHGIDFATGKDKTHLLVIELEDVHSVPTVKYKGRGITNLKEVSFDWDTDTAVTRGNMDIDIEYVDTSGDKPVTRREGVSKND